jgi:hypothetical protein
VEAGPRAQLSTIPADKSVVPVPLNPTVARRLSVALSLLSERIPKLAARDLLVSHAAADLALTTIAQQLGCTATTLDSALAELSPGTAQKVERQFNYLRSLSRAHAQLRASGTISEPSRWSDVKQLTIDAIGAITTEYLHVEATAFLPPEPVTPSLTEQRRSRTRYSCDGRVEVRVPYAGPPAKGTIVDVSAEGCCVECDFPFDISRRVELMLQVNQLTFRAMGIVANSAPRDGSDRHRFGIRFLALSAGGKQRLQELIVELGQQEEKESSEAGR